MAAADTSAMPHIPEFLTCAAVGAFAQLIDGAPEMACGVASAAMLLGLGLPSAVASASVHFAETFTCATSRLGHLAAGNVRRRLFWSLAIPGVSSAVHGVAVVSRVAAAWTRPALTPYLIGMGLLLLPRGRRGGTEADGMPRSTPCSPAVCRRGWRPCRQRARYLSRAWIMCCGRCTDWIERDPATMHA
jgi:uncharacterized protein